SIDKIAFRNVINGYLIYQNYYNYLIAKSDYGMAGMNMQTLAYKLMDTKADSLSIASAAYLGAIGYLTNTHEFKETDLFGISIIKNLNKANEIYSSHSLLSQSVDAIHILGDYAVYYYIIGDKEKAAKLQLEEKKKILQQFGSKGLEYAWMLSREGVIYHIMNEEEKAKACWIEAYNISSTLVQNKKEQYKFNIIQNNYNKCFGFFEEKPAPQIKSLSYYVDRIKNIPTLTISESNKSYQLIEFLPGLETLSPFPTETYLECIFAIHKLSMNSDSETDEFVALPNDLANTLNSFRNDSNMSENDINGILGQRNPNLNRMCILQAIFTLTQKEVITNETYSELLILLAETYLKEEKWEHAEVVLKEVISKYKDTKATNLKQLYATALLGKCYAKLYKTELCKEILEKLQKKLVRLEKGSYQTEQYISIHNSMADIYLCIGNHKAMFTYSDKIVELSKDRFDFLPYLYESIYRKALYLYEKGEYATCVELLIHVCEADYRIDNIKELNGILIRSLCQTNNPKAYSFLERYMNRVVKEFIPQYFAGKSQFLRDEFWGNQATQIIELNTEVARTFPNQKVLISAYNNVLFTKSLDVRYEQSMRETIKTADSYNQDLYAKMKAAQDSLHFGNPANSLLYKNFIAFAQSILNNYFIEAEVANIENKHFFRKVQNIEENRAIVEFVMIPHNNEPYYFAYITEKEKHFPI
ncbi:MAG: tetratricopeptide repeat protein, partial [Phocaeicola sp.]